MGHDETTGWLVAKQTPLPQVCLIRDGLAPASFLTPVRECRTASNAGGRAAQEDGNADVHRRLQNHGS